MDIELKNWLCSGKYRIEVLKALKNNPTLPSELALNLKIHRSSISRILKDLIREGLVNKTTRTTKTTTYFLTKNGENTVKIIVNEAKNEY